MKPNPFRVDPSLRAPKVERLARIIRDPASLSENYVRGIRELECSRHPDAPLVIGALLDMPGAVGDEAVQALVSLANRGGRRCRSTVVEDCWVRIHTSRDDDEIRNAHRVLAALGNEASHRALAARCWADAEEEERVLRLVA